ncbi:hypothetical protein LTR53_002584 [Teratosphaeriaceae sp. CCFEE 6253]|nr:hypothetical protein LTR53_002584 [Teratosphaeriaceae sp. CCFEE 6253]
MARHHHWVFRRVALANPVALGNARKGPVISVTCDAKPISRKTFLDLPPEIRNMIYTLALQCDVPITLQRSIVLQTTDSKGRRRYSYRLNLLPSETGIIHARLDLYQEAVSTFFSVNDFVISGPIHQPRSACWASRRGQIAKAHLRSFTYQTLRHEVPDFRLEVRTTPDNTIEVQCHGVLGLQCTCDLRMSLMEGAPSRMQESEEKISLAFAVVVCFEEQHYERLQRLVKTGAGEGGIMCGRCANPRVEQ